MQIFAADEDRARLPQKPLEVLRGALLELGMLGASMLNVRDEGTYKIKEELILIDASAGDGIAISLITAEGIRFYCLLRFDGTPVRGLLYQKFYRAVENARQSVASVSKSVPKEGDLGKATSAQPPKKSRKTKPGSKQGRPPLTTAALAFREKRQHEKREAKIKERKERKFIRFLWEQIDRVTYSQEKLQELQEYALREKIRIPGALLAQINKVLEIKIEKKGESTKRP